MLFTRPERGADLETLPRLYHSSEDIGVPKRYWQGGHT